MISEVRDFIKARLAEEDTSFREWKDGFNRDNIPKTIFNKSFFISLSNPANIATENCYVDDQVDAVVELFFKGFRSPQDALDNALDTAYNIKLRASSPGNWNNTVKYVQVDSIVPEPVVSNDNSIIVRMEMTVRLISAVL